MFCPHEDFSRLRMRAAEYRVVHVTSREKLKTHRVLLDSWKWKIIVLIGPYLRIEAAKASYQR